MRKLTEDENAANAATLLHIMQVNEYLHKLIKILEKRGADHDASKMEDPELKLFTKYTKKLKNTTYWSKKYKKILKKMQPALDHHYKNNKHHPEHYEDGINGMDLIDLVEMVCDWKAASLRQNDGDLDKSLKTNKDRFGIDDQLYQIIKNTLDRHFSS